MRQSIQEGRIAHAQLYAGTGNIAKLSLALAYAQYLNCPNRTAEDSCGTCPSCLQYRNLQHPDLHFAFPIAKCDAGDTCDDFVGSWREQIKENPYFELNDWYNRLGIDNKQAQIYEKEAGEILRKLSLKAFGDGYKVMIIWQADKMNVTCANKLLKLLEEPPEKTIFILTAENTELILPTIRSRVQEINIAMDRETEMVGRMQDRSEENVRFEQFIALMRNAFTIGQIKDPVKKYASLKAIRNWAAEMADPKVNGREKQKAWLQYAQRQVRENYIYNLQHPELNCQTDEERAFSSKFAPYIHDGNVEKIMEQLDLAEQQITQNGNAKIIFFDLALQFIVLIKK